MTAAPIFLLAAGAFAAGSLTADKGGGVNIPKREARPAVTAEAAKRTAATLPQGSEAARRNRQKAASLLTKGFTEPKLGTPGLEATSAIRQSSLLGL